MRLKDALAAVFSALTLVPLLVFWAWPYSTVLQSEFDEVRERHLLLARNLGSALERYHRDVSAAFDMLVANMADDRSIEGASELLHNLGFRHICMADYETGRVSATLEADCPTVVPAERFSIFQRMAQEDGLHFTGVRAGPDGRNLIYLIRRVGPSVAIGALETHYFVELGKSIAFGVGGHAVIIDQEGNVLAHPLQSWVAERRNLRQLPIVNRMLQGETSIATFFSPAFGSDMVAGFTSVRSAGWGVMIPQPVAELQAKADAARHSALAVLALGVVVAMTLAIRVARSIARPLDDIGEASRRVAGGDLGIRLETRISRLRLTELEQVRRSFNDMVERLGASVKRINQLAYVDAVTALANRECFRERADAFMNERRGRVATMFFIDLDNFKQVNDEHGHEVGDAVLRAFAGRLRDRFLGAGDPDDICPPDSFTASGSRPSGRPVVARLSGDEFALLVPDVGDETAVNELADAIGCLVRAPFLVGQRSIEIGVSIGAARFPEDGADFPSLLRAADLAMYTAKHAGKNRFELYREARAIVPKSSPEPHVDRRQVRSL